LLSQLFTALGFPPLSFMAMMPRPVTQDGDDD
jgi:hypothetical protein